MKWFQTFRTSLVSHRVVWLTRFSCLMLQMSREINPGSHTEMGILWGCLSHKVSLMCKRGNRVVRDIRVLKTTGRLLFCFSLDQVWPLWIYYTMKYMTQKQHNSQGLLTPRRRSVSLHGFPLCTYASQSSCYMSYLSISQTRSILYPAHWQINSHTKK
jgi:hypothetical protein